MSDYTLHTNGDCIVLKSSPLLTGDKTSPSADSSRQTRNFVAGNASPRIRLASSYLFWRPLILQTMSPAMVAYSDVDEPWEEPPAKKRRFFAESSPEPSNAAAPVSSTDATLEINDATGSPPLSSNDEAAISSALREAPSPDHAGFDEDLLESFIGEKVPRETVQRLRDMADGDMERGKHSAMHIHDYILTENSNQHLLRWILEECRTSSATTVDSQLVRSVTRSPCSHQRRIRIFQAVKRHLFFRPSHTAFVNAQNHT